MARDIEYRFRSKKTGEELARAFRTAIEKNARAGSVDFRRPQPGDPFAAFEAEALVSTGNTSQNVPVLITIQLFGGNGELSGTVTGRSRGGVIGLFERKLCTKLMTAVSEELQRADPQLRTA